jgi:hypothetical protein
VHPRKAEALKAQAMQDQAKSIKEIDDRLDRIEKKLDLLLKAATGKGVVSDDKKAQAARKAGKQPDENPDDADPAKQPETPPADTKPAE